ncbi:MAG: cyanophycinase [Pseudomonadota bacterium]
MMKSRGSLALIGGRFEPDNDQLYSALRDRCDGRIAILSMASGYPEEVGADTEDEFRKQGFYAEHIPIYYESRDQSPFDLAHIERLRAFGSVFFTGGDQSRIVDTLRPEGKETPALQVILELYASGGLIAGSSAGAAIMSGPMIKGGTSLNAVSQGVAAPDDDDYDAFHLGTGLGFFTWGLVDQHFLQRGRIGRLFAAARHFSQRLAFGVDENSALLVEGERGTVVGETGVLMLDLGHAKFDEGDFLVKGARVSYIDSGDSLNLRTGKVHPASDKRRIRVGRHAYRSPAPVRRHAFSSYGMHDLLLRLAEGDPAFYSEDSATAFDPKLGHQVTLNLSRKPRVSRALRGRRSAEIRYTAINFALDIQRTRLNSCPLIETTEVLRPDPAPDAQLVLLGNSPTVWPSAARQGLLSQFRGPVGILATASGEPGVQAERYLDWLESAGVHCEVLPISLSNIERASRDRALMRTIDRMGSLLLTGGDQRRLTEALLHCAEATPVLHKLVTAFERGVPLIAVAGAASALGDRMIAEGDSVSALRYGSSEDAGFSGVVVERGIGLARLGLIDQHFLRRKRLGRLLMACVEQRQRFGFGLCEGGGLIVHGNGASIEAVGSAGVVIIELDLERVRLAPRVPDPAGIRLYVLESGREVKLQDLAAQTAATSSVASVLLEDALADLEDDYRAALGLESDRFDASRWRQVLPYSSVQH